MADTKISALPAASAADAANELPINEAGTTKKVTAAQIKTLVTTAPTFAAGSARPAGTWPKLTTGTLLTTAEAGALELAGGTLFATHEGSNRGTLVSEHWIRQAAARTLTSTTSLQKLFDSSTNGTLTLPVGVYEFKARVGLTSMSATSGNLQFDILGAGGATLADILWAAQGVDGAAATTSAWDGSYHVTVASGTNVVPASAATSMIFVVQGGFEVTVAGTIIPSVALFTANAASVRAGSIFLCHRLGDTNAAVVGNWS